MAKAARRKKRGIEQELAALEPACDDPSAEGATALLDAALASGHAHVVARAATVVKEHGLARHEGTLRAAWTRLVAAGPDADTGCHGKLAVLEALDYTEHSDTTPFLEATRYVQNEARWGKPEDSAGNVRVRGALALTRLRYSDMLLVLGRLLADGSAHVREGSADALAEHGDRDGAGLLLLRLGVGEEEPSVMAALVRALFVLAPDEAACTVRPLLRDRTLRELVAHAAVSANVDDAVALLIDELAEQVLAADREVILRALGVSRRQVARNFLLSRVAEAGVSDARAAVLALGVHAYDPRLAEQVREAARRNDVDLREALARAFPT